MTVVIYPLAGAGLFVRTRAVISGLLSRRLLLRLVGVETVVLEGRALAVRQVPLGIARQLVPALLRCSRRFAAWEIDGEVYDDMVTVLSLGLNVRRQDIERLTVSLWDLSPVVEKIAIANGMPMAEAGRADLGKTLAALMTSTGTKHTPGSSVPPDGRGTTSTNA